MASTTVVSARTLSVLSTLSWAAFWSNVWLSVSIVASPQRVVIFMSVVGLRHRHAEGDVAEPPPRDGVGHLPAEDLVAELVAKLEEHHAQVGLDRSRPPALVGVEMRPIGLKERLVVQQGVDPGQLGRQVQAALRQDRLPQALVGVLGHEHGASFPCATRG